MQRNRSAHTAWGANDSLFVVRSLCNAIRVCPPPAKEGSPYVYRQFLKTRSDYDTSLAEILDKMAAALAHFVHKGVQII